MGLFFESIFHEILFFISLVLGYLYYKVKKRLRYFADRGVPYVEPRHFFEYNTPCIFEKKILGDKLHELYVKFDGPKYGGYFQFYKPSILICDPDLVMKVLKTDFPHFNDHGFPIDPEENYLDDNVFSQTGAKWRALRKTMAPTFTSGKLKGMTSLITECISNLTKYLDERLSRDFELKDTLSKFTIDVISSCAFGVDSQSLQEEESELKKMGKKILSMPLSEKLKMTIQTTMPRLLKILGITVEEKEIADFFKSFLLQSFEHRKATGARRNDFIDLLIQLKEKGSVEVDTEDKLEIEAETDSLSTENFKLEITDEILTAQLFVFFLAGHETSSSALTLIFYLLAKNPVQQEKARAEVREIKAKFRKIDYEAVKAMKYVNACIVEGMRIYPPISALPRACTKEYVMEDGFVVEKGTPVLIPIKSLHHDPKYYPDPESFIPERFLRGDVIRPGTYLPFGDGPRICIAKRFAMLEMQLTLAHILDRYEISPNPKMLEPMVLTNHVFIPVAVGGTWITLKKL